MRFSKDGMTKSEAHQPVLLDLNNPVFQENLFHLPKPDRHSALETLRRIRQMSWDQVYRDHGLKWEKIASFVPPPGSPALYSIRLSQSRRATAYRDGTYMRLVSIAADHDATYGRK